MKNLDHKTCAILLFFFHARLPEHDDKKILSNDELDRLWMFVLKWNQHKELHRVKSFWLAEVFSIATIQAKFFCYFSRTSRCINWHRSLPQHTQTCMLKQTSPFYFPFSYVFLIEHRLIMIRVLKYSFSFHFSWRFKLQTILSFLHQKMRRRREGDTVEVIGSRMHQSRLKTLSDLANVIRTASRSRHSLWFKLIGATQENTQIINGLIKRQNFYER